MSKGKIIQVMGPVVDVAFEDDGLPHIKDALVVDNQGKKCVMEVGPACRRQCGALYYAGIQRRPVQGYGSGANRRRNTGSCRREDPGTSLQRIGRDH